MTPIEASKTTNGKEVFSNLKDKRGIRKPNFNLSQLVGTVDIKRVFSKNYSTNYSYNLYKITEVIHDTIPSNIINFLPVRYDETLVLSTKLTLEENNEVKKKLNLIE